MNRWHLAYAALALAVLPTAIAWDAWEIATDNRSPPGFAVAIWWDLVVRRKPEGWR